MPESDRTTTPPSTIDESQRLKADLENRRQQHLKRRARKLTGWTRFIAIVPAIALFISAIALALATFGNTIHTTQELISGHIAVVDVGIEYIEYADLFLLAVVLYMLGLGLISLFISDKIPLPKWLEFHDFDDLKERLVSVISVMLGVYFLGVVLEGHLGIDILWLGGGCALIIVALAYFIKNVFKDE